MFSLNYKGLTPVYEVHRGIHLHRIKVSNLIFKLSALAYTFPFYHNALKPAIRDFIKRVSPDALHVHDMLLAKAVFAVNKNLKLPLTLDLHENRPEILQFYPHLKRFPSKQLISIDAWRRAQRDLIKKADHVVMVTPEAINNAIKETGEPTEKFFDVANTIELNIYDAYEKKPEFLQEYKETFNLVYVGDTGTRRGILTAIQALCVLKERFQNLRLIIVGQSSEDRDSKRKAEELGVSSMIHWAGWQDVSLFPSYIEKAAICISPLYRNQHHDTTLANKLFQYMAGAKALIVSDCPSQVHIVENAQCGLVHKANDHEDLAKCILQYYQDENLLKVHGQNARKAVEAKYNWALTSKALIDHYDNL